jgi:hypothetical protein
VLDNSQIIIIIIIIPITVAARREAHTGYCDAIYTDLNLVRSR